MVGVGGPGVFGAGRSEGDWAQGRPMIPSRTRPVLTSLGDPGTLLDNNTGATGKRESRFRNYMAGGASVGTRGPLRDGIASFDTHRSDFDTLLWRFTWGQASVI